MIDLPLCRYRFRFRAEEPGVLPAFSGSAWRGVFGRQLKRIVCVTKLAECEPCALVETCIFPSLFEGRHPTGVKALENLDRIPVGYVMEPEFGSTRTFGIGDEIFIHLTLIGHSNRRLTYVARAMADAGAGGVGPARSVLSLVGIERHLDLGAGRVEQVLTKDNECAVTEPTSPRPTSDLPTKFAVQLLSPLRIRIDGDLVTPDRFQPAHLIASAIRRISALSLFYGQGPISADYARMNESAARVLLVSSDLDWADPTRFSGRQKQKMKVGGIVGQFNVKVPPEAENLLPWLWLGQWVGAGKNTSMGLGQYRMLVDGRLVA